jgi:CRP-like cAMP-binding protein
MYVNSDGDKDSGEFRKHQIFVFDQRRKYWAMANHHTVSAPHTNRLLACLPSKEVQRLHSRLQPVSLEFKQILYEPRESISYVFFPNRGVVSTIYLMNDGSSIEVATIGNEGLVGMAAVFGAEPSPDRMMVQVPGAALRMRADDLRLETKQDSPLRSILVSYQAAFIKQITQSVACNGLHPVPKRCCRWILETHDRVLSDEFPMTHEFLSQMLGVRRVSVTEALKPLETAGLIHKGRGTVTVIDRKGLEVAACECYRSVQDEFDRRLGVRANHVGEA